MPANGLAHCLFEDGGNADVSGILGQVLRRHDRLRFLGATTEVLIERQVGKRCQQFLHATIGHVGLPKVGNSGQGYVRAELTGCKEAPDALFLSADAIRRYFYALSEAPTPPLYQLLKVPDTASPSQLRRAWRMQSLEIATGWHESRELSRAERAFNILAHPDLRNCYDAMLKDSDALPLFPYGGFGSILVEGSIAKDGRVFFSEEILAYRPELAVRKASLPIRQCEFFTDRILCRDRRRKLEVWLDSGLLPGVEWNLTWNQWKHWLRTRIEVDATFVASSRYRLQNGEWIQSKWLSALPSRLRVQVAPSLADDIRHATEIHALLGKNADLVRHIRGQCEKVPVEHSQVQAWFDEVDASPNLKPHHVTWRPDYEPFYFEQLRKRSRTWFVFRDEYLFVWRNAVIAELPQLGHATYILARPGNLEAFLAEYARVTRQDIRRNRDDSATRLGFVGRVVRGKRTKRWLAEVLKHAGERADYIEAFD